MDKKLFKKNLNSLKNEILKNKLKNLKPNKFKVSIGTDPLDINFISNDKITKSKLYENSLVHLNEKLNLYNDKYFLYPVLYFFGFGNGILYKALLQNQNHQKIVVFECELEFIYLSFHFVDFSKELDKDTLIILDINELNMFDFQILCSKSPFFQFLRVYFLEIHCDYYEKYHDEILQTNKNIQKHIKQNILNYGNDSTDAFIGIKNYLHNLPNLISNLSFNELILKRKKACKNAIIVSTGPSLTKQLPLLKQYANYAGIFCADGSYPILAKEGIKPDYVFSLERIEKTSEFFNNNFKEFDKNILFILSSVVHPNTIKYLKQNHRNFMLMQRDLSFNNYFNLKDFGKLSNSPSVANMAYFVAVLLEYENIIFIGQDLAYAKDGSSHPKDYHYSSTCDTYRRVHINTLAYGGKEQIKTHEVWNMFRVELEKKINFAKNTFQITTYNATEGGARIEGTIEKPFKELCEELLKKESVKNFAKINGINKENKKIELLLKSFYKLHQARKICEELIIKCSSLANKVHLLIDNENNFSKIIEQFDTFKDHISKILVIQEIIWPLFMQFELNLAKIYVLHPKTQEDVYNKKLLWIKEHLEWLILIENHIKILKETIENNFSRFESILIEKNMQKYIQKIQISKSHKTKISQDKYE
ncbi:motility associated factor glycosyltransferase family protein [Campylobacter sp. IFREMER_LSEM_CL2127]|uniref:motility associated factor glycosyltransferase family protein n=1 Tax=Campylobacter sp. IFREMER_LSEM_CL2127 TaxID=2911619 RepID=UPI0021E99F70|nr:motility associated factor glycosyltransferase family protein [Campylobacter sp. IFREMER_LSEM_CL2127]MCV3381104.1 motility associated factor glycosyltransferase family protein [Campylobacter sp. IFREMER_LSEM_CL2127]